MCNQQFIDQFINSVPAELACRQSEIYQNTEKRGTDEYCMKIIKTMLWVYYDENPKKLFINKQCTLGPIDKI